MSVPLSTLGSSLITSQVRKDAEHHLQNGKSVVLTLQSQGGMVTLVAKPVKKDVDFGCFAGIVNLVKAVLCCVPQSICCCAREIAPGKYTEV